MSQDKIIIFDTTLRDGEQSPGASMNLAEKLEVGMALRDLGVDVIEAGFPIASPGDFESVREIARQIHGPIICGLARCNNPDIDRAWEALKDNPKPRIHVFLATSAIHREFKLRMAKEEIVRRAVDGIKRAKSYLNDVEFSPEDAARQARYKALSEAVHTEWPEVRDVVLAQHADDQVETLLIALSRGAGLPGLASMPAHWHRQGLNWHRPFLSVPGAVLREWLQSQGQSWVEDPSNNDQKFTRNRIRTQVIPALADALPAFRETFARSASHAAEAQEILNDIAQADLAGVMDNGMPNIKNLQLLSSARQSLVLRHWLKVQHQTTPSAAQLAELLSQIASCITRGHQLHLKVGRGYVRREGAGLTWTAES